MMSRRTAIVRVLIVLAAGASAVAVSEAQSPRIAAQFSAGLADAATQRPSCTVKAVEAAAGSDMKIGPIDDLNPALPAVPSGVRLVPAAHGLPDYCLVTGFVVTDVPTRKTANFGFALPMVWNHRFVFSGCGHYCGQVFQSPPIDPHDGLANGNAIVSTDDGHASNPPGESLDASWALKALGVPDQDAIVDFYYRAVHTIATSGRQFVKHWYASAPAHSYFVGCSDGGREGMVEATRYPDDFDGYVVGDPFFDVPGQILAGRAAHALLHANGAFIPPELLRIVDRAVYASCDAADGMVDGLIQNPGNCAFDPASLLCRGGSTQGCLTQAQVDTLSVWFSAAKDPQGHVASFGYPVSDIGDEGAPGANLFAWTEKSGPPLDIAAPEPWGDMVGQQPPGWSGSDQALKYLVYFDATFDSNHDFPVDSTGTVDSTALALIDLRTAAGRGDDPQGLSQFLQHDRKLIMYHGFSDGFINPFRTISFYEQWAALVGGYGALGANARLFMVPGMFHCGGGPGPNVFNGVTDAIEDWVEHGVAPDTLIATKYTNDDPTQAVTRTMPLCPFPTQARYSGTGPVNAAASWSCTPNEDLLQVGPDGISAGLSP